MHSSLQAFAQAKSVRMMGTVTYGADAYDVDLSVDSRKRAAGTVTHAGDVVTVFKDGEQVFMKGQQYFGKRLKFPVFDRTVLFPADPVSGLVAQLADRPGLAAAVEKAAGGNVSSRGGSANGVKTTTLAAPQVTVQVPQGTTKPPVQLDTSPATNLGGNLTQLHLKLGEYGATPVLPGSVPDTYVNSADPATWPPYFVYVDPPNLASSNCDSSGCTWTSGFTNRGGKGPGTASAHFFVKLGDKEVAGCDAPLPPAGNEETVSASCRVSYDRTQGGNYVGTVLIRNPTS